MSRPRASAQPTAPSCFTVLVPVAVILAVATGLLGLLLGPLLGPVALLGWLLPAGIGTAVVLVHRAAVARRVLADDELLEQLARGAPPPPGDPLARRFAALRHEVQETPYPALQYERGAR